MNKQVTLQHGEQAFSPFFEYSLDTLLIIPLPLKQWITSDIQETFKKRNRTLIPKRVSLQTQSTSCVMMKEPKSVWHRRDSNWQADKPCLLDTSQRAGCVFHTLPVLSVYLTDVCQAAARRRSLGEAQCCCLHVRLDVKSGLTFTTVWSRLWIWNLRYFHFPSSGN